MTPHPSDPTQAFPQTSYPHCGMIMWQRSARLGLQSQDRDRDFLFLSLNFETETETFFL